MEIIPFNFYDCLSLLNSLYPVNVPVTIVKGNDANLSAKSYARSRNILLDILKEVDEENNKQ